MNGPLGAAWATTLAAFLACAPVSYASTVSGDLLFDYKGAPGERNYVRITPVAAKTGEVFRVLVSDSVPIKVRAGCSHPAGSQRRALCIVTHPDEPRFYVSLGDHSDRLYLSTSQGFTSSSISGGTGNDSIVYTGQLGTNFLLGPGNDVLRGGPGADFVFGGSGNDRIHGNGGGDTLKGEAGADWLYGGEGNDSLTGGLGVDHLLGGPGVNRLDGAVRNSLVG